MPGPAPSTGNVFVDCGCDPYEAELLSSKSLILPALESNIVDRTGGGYVPSLRNLFCTMTLNQVVSRDPDVVSGALVFRGTRVPVQTLVDYLKSGETLDSFLDGFPSVRREQAEAYLELTLREVELRV